MLVNLPHIVDYEYRAIWHHWEVGRVVVRKDLHISDTHLLLRATVQHWGKGGDHRSSAVFFSHSNSVTVAEMGQTASVKLHFGCSSPSTNDEP